MMAFRIEMFPNSEETSEFIDNFFHEYYYSLSAECDDGTIIISNIDHYREISEKLELWKQAVYTLGGGTINLIRYYDKLIELPDDEEDIDESQLGVVEATFYVYDDESQDGVVLEVIK